MPDKTPSPTPTTRRRLMRLAGFAALAGVAYGGTGLLRRLSEPALEFEPVKGVPGFRWIEGGPISGGATVLVGIGAGEEQPEPDARISDRALCGALFGSNPDPSRVQIAYFTDYRCFYCRSVSAMLADLEKSDGVQITWHDLPLLGQVSTIAARAAVAAGEQGAYDVFHTRLMGTPAVPTPPYLREISAEAGINAARLLRDMQSEKVTRHLRKTAAVARRFGFIGTPAMVIGRTAVMGDIDRRMVDRIIAEERKSSPATC